MLAGRTKRLLGFLALASVLGAGSAYCEPPLRLSDRITEFTRGLICAPPEGGRRDAPDTASGWIHVPDEPIHIRLEGTTAPALLGTGFGVRFAIAGDAPMAVRYEVHHPALPPTGTTRQSWDSMVFPGGVEQVFFQFDIAEELQPGPWSFTAISGEDELFHAGFDIVPAEAVPHLSGLCLGGDLLALSQRAPGGSD